MDRDPPPPPPPRSTSSTIPVVATRGSPMVVRGATSSPMLTAVSSPSPSSSTHSRRRYYSSSLYPPPLPAVRFTPGSTSTTAARYTYGSGSASSPSRFQFRRRQQIPPPAATQPERPSGSGRPRANTMRALPTPFLSELAAIRSVGAALFGDLDAPEIRRGAALHGGGHHRHQQPWPSSAACGQSLSGFAPPPPPSAGTGMPPPPHPSRRFSGGFSSSQPSSSRVPPAGTFSVSPPSWARSSSTGLAPLPMSRRLMQPPPSTRMPPVPPGPHFSGPGRILSQSRPWATQQQQQAAPQPPLSTPLAPAPLRGGYGMVLSGSGSQSPASQQQQEAQPLHTGTGILFPGFPSLPASQQAQAHPWPSTDLASALSSVSSGSSIFTTGSTSTTPASQQQQMPANTSSSFTDLAPLPTGCGFSEFTTPNRHTNESTTMFGSFSWSPADMATAAGASDTMSYGNVQPSSSDSSQLPPLPQSLQMQPEYENQASSFWQQPSGNDNRYGTETGATAAYTATELSEGTRMQAPTTHMLQVVKEEPVVDEDQALPCLDPVFIALDDDGQDDELLLSALWDSLQQPSGEAASSLPNQHAPLSSEGWLQPRGIGGSGAGGMLGNVEGSGQSWDLEALLQTPGSSSASGSIIPMNYQGSVSMSQLQQQQQIPPQQGEGDVFSTGLSDIAALQWQMSQNNTSGFGQPQPQPNQQTQVLPFSTDRLHHLNNISSPSPSIWGPAAADGSGQGWGNSGTDIVSGQEWAGLPALANMFNHMSIIGQGGLTAPEAAGGQYDDMFSFDNNYTGNSNSAWPDMPSSASNFNQMDTGGGGMSIGQGFPETQAPMFDINGGSSSSSAWTSMQLNFSSSSTMETSIPSVPNLRLSGMDERPRVARWTPSSLSAGASSSGMPQRGAYGDFFSEADIAAINKDKRLKEMVNTDPKRVKRILNNRASVAKLRVQRHAEFQDLS